MAVTTSSTTDGVDAKSEEASARDGDKGGGNASDAADVATVPSVVDYVVKRGDTLYEIATTHGTTTQAIVEESDIGIRRTIEVGETLRVPLDARRASFAVRSRYGLVPKQSTVGTTPASKRLSFLKRSISALGPKKRTVEVVSWSTPVSLAHATRAHAFGSGTILAFGLLAVFSQARSNRVKTRVASALSTKAAPTDESLAESPPTSERASSSVDALRDDTRRATEPVESERPGVVNPSEEIEYKTSTTLAQEAESTQMASETETPLERVAEETGSAKEDVASATKDEETDTKREGREAFVEMNAISGAKTTAIVVDVDEMESKVEEAVSKGREKESPKRREERVSKLSPKKKRSASQSRRRLSTPNVRVDEVEDLGYLPAALIGKGVYVAQVAFDFTRALMDKAFKKLSS